MGFAGGYDDFTADILGDDFVTVPLVWKPKFDSKGIPTALPPSASWLNYARIEAETGASPGNWLFFAVPDDDGSCERIDSVTIAIPPLTFADRTQVLIDSFREEQDKTAALDAYSMVIDGTERGFGMRVHLNDNVRLTLGSSTRRLTGAMRVDSHALRGSRSSWCLLRGGMLVGGRRVALGLARNRLGGRPSGLHDRHAVAVQGDLPLDLAFDGEILAAPTPERCFATSAAFFSDEDLLVASGPTKNAMPVSTVAPVDAPVKRFCCPM